MSIPNRTRDTGVIGVKFAPLELGRADMMGGGWAADIQAIQFFYRAPSVLHVMNDACEGVGFNELRVCGLCYEKP